MAFSKESPQWNKRAHAEYQVQHFGMTAKSLAEEVAAIYTGSIEAGLEGLIYYILNEKKEKTGKEIDENEEKEARRLAKQYEAQVIETGQVALRTIKDYCEKKVFIIPDNILLPKDSVQEQEFQESQIDHEQLELLERLKTLRYMEAAFEKELEDAEKILPEVSGLVEKTEKVVTEMNKATAVPATQLEQLLEHTKSIHNEIRAVIPEPEKQEEENEEQWDDCTPPSADSL